MDNFDISEFAKMFDAALASDNPSVKKALKNFMMVAAVVHAQDQNETEHITGPLETLIKRVDQLERMVRDLSLKDQYTRPTKEDYYSTYKNPGTWVYNSNTSTSNSTGSPTDIISILKDVKF